MNIPGYASSPLRIAEVKELLLITTKECGEPLVEVKTDTSKGIIASAVNDDMQPFAGSRILVRKSVHAKLINAALILYAKGFQLRVGYGWRHPSIQEKYYEEIKTLVESRHPKMSTEELAEAVHQLIAVPVVAGHPTGGAVDVEIIGKEPDLCGQLWVFFNQQTFSPEATKTERKHRLILREAMVISGFLPFDGEWWHFCYGDKEWAALAEEKHAIYEPIRNLEL